MAKQLKIGLLVAGAVLALGAALFYAQPDSHGQMNNTPKAASNVLSVSEDLHDFGTISMKNGKVSAKFTVKNIQNQPIALSKLYTSCMCTQAKLLIGGKEEGPFGMLGHGFVPTFNETLAPGEQAEVEAIFDPNAHGPAGVGLIERTITLEDGNGPVATMQIKANVTP